MINNLEETNRKDIILRRKGEAGNLRGQENIGKRNLLIWHKKIQFSSKKYRYLEWTKGRGDNGKEYTTTKGKNKGKTWKLKFNGKKMPCIWNGIKCNETLMDV